MSSASYIRSGLVRRGLPEHVADAFMANFRDESGLNPGINEARPIVPGSRGGFGLYQLTGPRRREYEAFASKRGVPAADVDAQLDFMMGELSGSEKRAGDRILSAPDTASAAQAIVNDFLRPSPEHRARRAASYAGLGGGAPGAQSDPSPVLSAMMEQGSGGGGGSPNLAGNAGTDTLPAAGGDMTRPNVHIGIKPEQSTEVFDAMLANATMNGGKSANVGEAISNLAQIYAARSGKSKAEAANAGAVEEAMMAANLDPEYAVMARLAGGRNGVLDAMMAQQQSRATAANREEDRAWRQGERDYQREQDTVANARADRTVELQTAKANAPADPPSSVREYQFAQSQGFQGSYADWEQQNRRAGATVVNTGDASGSGAFYKKADETRATAFNDIANAGMTARRNGQQIDQLERLLGGVDTGGVARMKQIAGQWGINTEGLDDIQAASALINQMVPGQRPPGSGTMSDADLALFKQSIPSIINQPGGNAMIIQTMRGIGQYDAAMGDIANRVLNREIDPAEGQRLMAEVENPLARLREITGEQRGDAPAASAPAGIDETLWKIMTPEERALWN